MKKNRFAQLDHINFTVLDINKTIKWYDQIFNFKEVESGAREDGSKWSILKNGESMLCFSERPTRSFYTGNKYHQIFHFALRLKDKAEWEKTVEKYSLQVEYDGAVKYPHSHSWYIQDPTGHEIEVVVWDNNKIQF